VVVTVVVGTTVPLLKLPKRLTAISMPGLFAGVLAPSAEKLVALEVIWSPAEEDDRLSSLELRAIYPDLLPLAGADALGQRSCSYCSAVYAAELGGCPSCGAPVERAASAGEALAAAAILDETTCTHCQTRYPGYYYRCPSCGARRF